MMNSTMMRKVTPCLMGLLMLVAMTAEVQAQNTLSLLWFRAGSVCPLESSEVEISSGGPYTVMDDVVEGNSLGCLSDSQFYTDNWSTAASVTIGSDPFLSFRFTMNPGASSVSDGIDDQVKIWGIFRDADGPTLGQVYYSLEGAPFLALGSPFAIAETDANPEIILPILVIDENESMDFRLYAWNAAAASGTLTFAHLDYISDAVLPVELTAFDARVDGADVLLTWETASETNNAGFEIQRVSKNEGATPRWGVVDYVEGSGTTEQPHSYQYRLRDLDPGSYTFRLKQIDYDGTFEYHPEVEVLVEVPTAYFLSAAYPNPFNPQAQFRLSVGKQQRVAVMLYNALGQVVATLFEGTMAADVTRTFSIDGSDLPGGVYLYRVTGEVFSESRPVILVK